MAMTEDISDFFDDNEFSVVALWKGTTSVNVIYDHEYTEQFGAAGSNPIVIGDINSLPGVARGDSLNIDSVSYTIETIEPDGTGLIRFRLLRT